MAKSKLLAMGAAGVLAASALLGGTAQAKYDPLSLKPSYNGTNLFKAIIGGNIYLEFRPRYEYVNDSAPTGPGGTGLKEANALTLRSVLGYQTGRWYGFGIYGKFLNVSHLAGQAFNEPVTNPNPEYATVADPATTQIQEAYVSYRVPANLYPNGPAYLDELAPAELKFGRQVITLQNHRWIGNVVWRQVWLTYDGFSANYELPGGGHLFYAHLYNANRPPSANARADKGFPPNTGDVGFQTDLINLEFDLERWIGAPTNLVGYAYLIDFDNNDNVLVVGTVPQIANSSEASNKTFGVRLKGEIPFTSNEDGLGLLYLGEFANQSNYAGGSSVIEANYYKGVLGLGGYGVKLTANYEILGTNGGEYSVQTPFDTAFAMNGWADRIPSTGGPPIGLVDAWVQADATSPDSWGPVFSGLFMTARYHDFRSDRGDIKYGQEFDFRVTKAIAENITLLAQYAIYWGDDEAATSPALTGLNLDQDIQKAWLMGTFKF
ncbi:MAG: alginate export family protein [Nitrococcus sp.]|nr:alginate export family protein [Nitrococcus sp.]